MATPIVMPQIGYDIDTGRVLEWRAVEHEAVVQGDVVAVVESEKATFEVEAPASGTLLKILYGADSEAPVLKPIAWVGEEGEALDRAASVVPAAPDTVQSDPDTSRAPAGTHHEAAPAPAPAAVAVTPDPATGRTFASPVARRLAREQGIDIAAVSGTGPGGRVVARDIAAFSGVPIAGTATGPSSVSQDGDTEVLFSRMRSRIAARLTRSAQTVPHFYLLADVDVTNALAWRRAQNEKNSTHLTINDLVVHATAAALRAHPRMNAHVAANRMVLKSRVNIGVAVSVDDGLLVPVIPDADWKDLSEISSMSRRNRDEARRGVIDMSVPGTFTISNIGRTPVKEFLPIINQPECAILGVGTVQKRVVPIDTGIGTHDMLTLTLAADHRAVDGGCAGEFLGDIKRRLEAYRVPGTGGDL